MKPKKKPDPDENPKKSPPNLTQPTSVVLLNDDTHSYEYVIVMLVKVCGVSPEEAIHMAAEVDETGRVVVWTGHKEYAEFKQEQIQNWGRDPNLEQSTGSMSAILVP